LLERVTDSTCGRIRFVFDSLIIAAIPATLRVGVGIGV